MYTKKQIDRITRRLTRKLDNFELKKAKEAYKQGLYGYILLDTGVIERYDTYKLFKKMYKRYSKQFVIDELFYKEALQDA